MQSMVPNSTAAESDLAVNDLGPLAWVLDELRKSLEGATKALKRFVWEAEAARGSDLAALDASQLRIARQQLHQSVGALEMVGLPAAAPLLRSMESAVQKFIVQPEQCSQDAVAKIEFASFALTEYLAGVLAGKEVSAVSLFPQYRDVQTLLRADRIHPADLWPMAWRWLEPSLTRLGEPRSYGVGARAVLDQAVLQLMKGKSPQAARQLSDLSLGFSVNQADKRVRIFWVIAAAYFEALAQDLLQADLYVRRAASRILLQYTSLAKGDTSISDRLAQDLVFFCAQAAPGQGDYSALSAVRLAYGLAAFRPVNYELIQFGRFDPALLSQARKRITSAKESWSSLAAGDTSKSRVVADQFNLVADSLVRLHAPSELLAQALVRSVDSTARSAQTPRIELAMEVATSVLYLEAVFEDLDPNDPQMAVRTANLAQRLEAVSAGGEPQPLESWMEELYRRVSDRQTMGSVVGELRVSLGELEKALDIFFRNPQDKTTLQAVPGKLSQMRGVLSVLGLDQASRAVLHMKGSVDQMLDTEIDEQQVRSAGTFEHLGNNLGALSFLIDMLNYQPALAKKLFVYDDEKGELKPLMGRSHGTPGLPPPATITKDALVQELVSAVRVAADAKPGADIGVRLDALATHAALADQPDLARSARQAALAVSGRDDSATANALSALASSVVPEPVAPVSEPAAVDFEEDDLQDIFLEEATEVVGQARQALGDLEAAPEDASHLTILRRAFHTLKGSSRMVGLPEFGEAAWAFEQLVNSWLADQKPAGREFLALSCETIAGFSRWISDIAARRHASWSAEPFCLSAEAMRNGGHYLALSLSGDSSTQHPAPSGLVPEESYTPQAVSSLLQQGDLAHAAVVASDSADAVHLTDESFDFLPEVPPHESPAEIAVEAASAASSEDIDFNFDSLFDLPGAESTPVDVLELQAAAVVSHAPEEEQQAVKAVELSAADLDLHFEAGAPMPEPIPVPASAFLSLIPVAQEPAPAEAGAPLMSLPDTASEPPAPTESPDLLAPFESLQSPDRNDALELPEPDEQDEPDESLQPDDNNDDDEKIKVIGGLRIGIPLYNVYLNEADEWSRRLVTEIAEWALEGHQPVSASTVALAHSLAGSSATVGFSALSEMARALEHALEKSHDHHRHGSSSHGQVFVDASEDIRRLLHQFAAGFLKQPGPDILERLNQLDFSDSVLPDSQGMDELEEFNFVDESEEAYDRSLTLVPDTPFQDEWKAGQTETGRDIPGDMPRERAAPSFIAPFALTPVPAATFAGARLLAFNDEAESEDGIDAVDAIDADLFPIFEEECAELMPQLGGALRQWSSRPDNQSARLEVLRVLHTLKGSARLAGAMRLGEMAHRIESEIEYLGSEAAASQEFEPLLSRFDRMQTVFERLRHADARAQAAPPVEPLVPLSPVVTIEPFASTPPESPSAQRSQPEPVPETPAVDTSVAQALPLAGESRKIVIPAPQMMAMQPLRQAATASIRVRSQLLDRMVNQAGEVMITRSRLEAEIGQLRDSLNDMSGNLNRLRHQLRDIELQAESQMQSRLAQAKEAQAGFDPLEFDRFTRVQELTRMMAESVNDVATVQRTLQRTIEATEDDLIAQARQTRDLQRDLLRTRMVEFEGISDRLYRVVRQASKDTGKQVRLDLLGGTIEMDRGMLDRMTPAFEHLLRNCVAHGIESPQDRAEAGKDPIGLITVHLRQEGNDVAVDFSDDGAGLDLRRIQEKAVSLGLLDSGQVLDNQAAANLIFTPGFSTATQVTELSGRGIGMDVVRAEVNALGGRIETSTEAGKGSHFKLVLPLTTAVTQVVMMRTGSLCVGVPANVVETVRRVTARELQQAYNTGSYEIAGETVPFFWSGALLQASPQSSEAQTRTTPIVVFRSAAQRIALHVDEVLGNREVVVKHLGPQLSRLPGLAGMSVLASGAVVLIYNPVALATIYGEQARRLSADRAEPHMLGQSGKPAVNDVGVAPASQAPLILVVDDSITVRRVTQRLLLREGYRVVMAADGLQALERLQDELPAVVLSDIEMPRMDGFDLARNIRADQRLKDLPIVMITSRIAEKHRDHAKELGVNHYLGKPYSEDELIGLVRHYASREVAISA